MDEFILSVFVIFGTIILMGYLYMAWFGKPPLGSGNLWNGIKGNLKYLYVIMIILSFAAGAYLFYYLTFKEVRNKEILYAGVFILLLFSTAWAISPFYFKKSVLFMASVGALLIMSGLIMEMTQCNSRSDPYLILATAFSVLLFFQTFFMDFLIWSGAFRDGIKFI